VSGIARGEVWWGELPETGRRPFLVMTRNRAIPVLTNVLAAPVTRTVRGIPTELALGLDDGMPAECVASFDNLHTVSRSLFRQRITRLGVAKMNEACQALERSLGCA